MFTMLRSRTFVAMVATAIFGVGAGMPVWAQPDKAQVIVQQDGNRVVKLGEGTEVEVPADGSPARVRSKGQLPGQPPPGGPPMPGAAQPKPGDAPGGAPGNVPGKESEESKANVQRPTTPPEPPDPQELEVKPDDEGLVRFQFRNQPWPDVLRWLAKVSDVSLDWQELPGDYLNLATRRPYTIEEATDTINRALLLRGFTILEHDGVMLVAKTEGLNPALVPRVPPEQLMALPPNRFVRTSFELTWLIAEQVNIEFASMISTNGKLTPLVATNRLEAMDAVSNLRDIYGILTDEQSGRAMQNLAREFVLEYAKASAIKLKLEEFLGIQRSATASSARSGRGMDPMQMMQQQQQMQMQQMQQMQKQQMQQAQAGGGGPVQAQVRRSDALYLVANDRTNSLIVHAPPDKMAIIEAFVKRVDVPNENAADFQRVNTRMKVFRLASLSPNDLVESLTAMDVLEPGTRLQVDAENNAIIAYASVADQYLIQSVVERLDGSERSFEVVQLRRLQAEAVAGSIKFLMGAEDEDKNSSRRNYGYYDYYGGYGGRNSNTNQKSDKMRVGANVKDNQLLLWANPIEMDEVRNLLVKLGEVPPEGGRRDTVRIIDASRQVETFEYLQRLKKQWEQVAPNPLDIPDASEFQPVEPVTPAAENESKAGPAKNDSESPRPNTGQPPKIEPAGASNKITRLSPPPAMPVLVRASPFDDRLEPGSNDEDRAEADAASRAELAPPVIIRIDPAGNLILQSEDTQALDRLEEYMLANQPPRKPYDIYKVKYARASWVTLNLEEYFEKQKDEGPSFYSFFFDDFPSRNNKQEEQLGKKSPLRFIYDNDTRSIVVTGADDTDRQTIKELIELWDVPEPKDDDKDRYTRLLKIRYSRADAIVNTIKEAYRDLLSATDKSVQNPAGDQEEKRTEGGGGVVQPSGGLSYAFKGKLSLGADTITNSILVSAEGEALMEVICDMIQQLDEAAKPEGNVEVYKLSAEVNGKSLERALRAMLGTKSGQQQQPVPNGQQPNPNPNPEGSGQAAQAAPAVEAAGRGRRGK